MLNVVFASDDNYAPILGVAICSLLENNHIAKNNILSLLH